MNSSTKMNAFKVFRKIVSATLVLIFSFGIVIPPDIAQAQVVPMLPLPGAMVTTTPGYMPALIKGITIDPQNPLAFDFIIDTGDSGLDINSQQFRDESLRLVKYFMASMTVPADEMWVNLSPYEQDRMIPQSFGMTDMGLDLLAQDYVLKQLTASLVYPEEGLGKKFWSRIYEQAQKKFGTTDIPVDSFHKVWIVPGEAAVYEQDNQVFVIKNRLKVMMEEDYLALRENAVAKERVMDPVKGRQASEMSELQTQIMREVVLPAIEQEVNEGQHFARLRQIYQSMILATWYKMNLKESLLGQVYADQKKLKGVDAQDPAFKDTIYQQYVKAFETGVYNYIKEDYDPQTRQVIPRQYFSGGTNFGVIGNILMSFAQGFLSDNEREWVQDAVKNHGDLASVHYILAEIPEIGAERQESRSEFVVRSLVDSLLAIQDQFDDEGNLKSGVDQDTVMSLAQKVVEFLPQAKAVMGDEAVKGLVRDLYQVQDSDDLTTVMSFLATEEILNEINEEQDGDQAALTEEKIKSMLDFPGNRTSFSDAKGILDDFVQKEIQGFRHVQERGEAPGGSYKSALEVLKEINNKGSFGVRALIYDPRQTKMMALSEYPDRDKLLRDQIAFVSYIQESIMGSSRYIILVNSEEAVDPAEAVSSADQKEILLKTKQFKDGQNAAYRLARGVWNFLKKFNSVDHGEILILYSSKIGTKDAARPLAEVLAGQLKKIYYVDADTINFPLDEQVLIKNRIGAVIDLRQKDILADTAGSAELYLIGGSMPWLTNKEAVLDKSLATTPGDLRLKELRQVMRGVSETRTGVLSWDTAVTQGFVSKNLDVTTSDGVVSDGAMLGSVQKRHDELHRSWMQELLRRQEATKLLNLLDRFWEVKGRSEDTSEIESKIAQVVDAINYDRRLDKLASDGKITGPKTFKVKEFVKSSEFLDYLNQAENVLLEGEYVPQFIFAGKATRLNRGAMYSLDVWDIAVEEGSIQEDERSDFHLGMGPRQLLAYRMKLMGLAKKCGVNAEEVLKRQYIVMNLNDEVESIAMDDLIKNNFYGFDPSKMMFLNQPEFSGYRIDSKGQLFQDEESPSLVYGHGDNAIQFAAEGEAYQISSQGQKEYLEKSVLEIIGDRYIGTHRVNDLTKWDLNTVVDVEKLALSLKLQDDGHRIVADLVANPKKQKGGTASNVGLIETLAVNGSKALTEFVAQEGERGAPYNAFRLVYKADTLLEMLKTHRLNYYLRVKDGFLYLESVTGDLTQFEDSNTAFVQKEDDLIHDFKNLQGVPEALVFLKTQDEQLKKAGVGEDGSVMQNLSTPESRLYQFLGRYLGEAVSGADQKLVESLKNNLEGLSPKALYKFLTEQFGYKFILDEKIDEFLGQIKQGYVIWIPGVQVMTGSIVEGGPEVVTGFQHLPKNQKAMTVAKLKSWLTKAKALQANNHIQIYSKKEVSPGINNIVVVDQKGFSPSDDPIVNAIFSGVAGGWKNLNKENLRETIQTGLVKGNFELLTRDAVELLREMAPQLGGTVSLLNLNADQKGDVWHPEIPFSEILERIQGPAGDLSKAELYVKVKTGPGIELVVINRPNGQGGTVTFNDMDGILTGKGFIAQGGDETLSAQEVAAIINGISNLGEILYYDLVERSLNGIFNGEASFAQFLNETVPDARFNIYEKPADLGEESSKATVAVVRVVSKDQASLSQALSGKTAKDIDELLKKQGFELAKGNETSDALQFWSSADRYVAYFEGAKDYTVFDDQNSLIELRQRLDQEQIPFKIYKNDQPNSLVILVSSGLAAQVLEEQELIANDALVQQLQGQSAGKIGKVLLAKQFELMASGETMSQLTDLREADPDGTVFYYFGSGPVQIYGKDLRLPDLDREWQIFLKTDLSDSKSAFNVYVKNPSPRSQDKMIIVLVEQQDAVGGIDLNPNMMDLKIKRDGRGVPLPMSDQSIEALQQIEGFLPVIINVTPIQNLPMLLGLDETDDDGTDQGGQNRLSRLDVFDKVSL